MKRFPRNPGEFDSKGIFEGCFTGSILGACGAGDSNRELTHALFPSLSIFSDVQSLRVDEASTVRKVAIANQSLYLLAINDSLEIDERFIWINANAVSRQAIVHDLYEPLRVRSIRSDQDEVVNQSKQKAVSRSQELEMLRL